jgi:disulfide bond formation protein DsbB
MSSRALLIFGIAASLGAVGIALVSQHMYDMQPCPWCVLQRLVFVAIALACVIGLFARRLGAALALLLSLCGIAAALWQHFVAAASASCKLTLAERIISGLTLDSLAPEVFQARASCADAAVELAGLPYEFWSLALFAVIGAAMCRALVAAPYGAVRRSPRGGTPPWERPGGG